MGYEEFVSKLFAGREKPSVVNASSACWALFRAEQIVKSLDDGAEDGSVRMTNERDDDIRIALASIIDRLREDLGVVSDSEPFDADGFTVE